MMHKKMILLGLLFLSVLLSAQSPDINLGGIDFPKAYIHAGKEFPGGIYGVVLTLKEAVPFFNVYNSNEGLLFEEMAIVMENSRSGKKSAFRLQKGFVKGKEFFRIKVMRSGQTLMAYFLVKK
ncbi:MAG: hypothetical protein NTZ12_09375 [Candidatus Aminicenantes bacterium]|nr:hypothetical protein [Candidatus Aminicenantes bacterium]